MPSPLTRHGEVRKVYSPPSFTIISKGKCRYEYAAKKAQSPIEPAFLFLVLSGAGLIILKFLPCAAQEGKLALLVGGAKG